MAPRWEEILQMGRSFSVAYACLFLCHLEKEVNHIMSSPKINFFKWFIDNGFLVWSGSQDQLHAYLECYESIYPHNIHITSCIYSTCVNLLDVVLFKGLDFQNYGNLSTKCYQKLTNAYQYILFTSWHLQHQFYGAWVELSCNDIVKLNFELHS